MKSTKKVEVKEVITAKEYNEFKQHAINTGFWWATNYSKNSFQIREKLYQKGYPVNTVIMVKEDGSKVRKDIVEEAIRSLVRSGIIDDSELLDSQVRKKFESGKSSYVIKSELIVMGFPKELIEESFSKIIDEDLLNKSISKAYDKAVKSYSVKKLDNEKDKEQKIISILMQKGFPYADIKNLLNALKEAEEDL